jgi:periplasmic glucans biosynthesis protein
MSNEPATGASLNRRGVLLGTSAFVAVAALADSLLNASDVFAQSSEDSGQSFAAGHVQKLAEDLSSRAFAKPANVAPEPFNALTAEQYRDIRFRHENSIWRGENLDYELHLLAMGWLYDVPVEIWIVDGDKARALKANSANFSIGPSIEKAPDTAPFGFSGFRLAGVLNRASVMDEFVSFQGASYFKSMGRGQQFGLAARALAINTARPGGEEFPFFRSFWIEKPAGGQPHVVIHALLDSESLTGAYRFTVRPGAATTIDVEGSLFPRKPLSHVGLAPLSSMYLHGPQQRRFGRDYRPAVHNSEGLAVVNGQGERLWRPLGNPKMLQTSAFVDKNLKGFGLCQRNREFSHYDDLDARYERRPTLWIEPIGGWGDGYVELIEIPVTEEIHDNIVAYWKPANVIEPGKRFAYAYRMSWGEDVPVVWAGSWVGKTQVGAARSPDTLQFVIDFVGPSVRDARDLPVADLVASSGSTSKLSVQRNPDTLGIRVKFELNTAGTELIEMRLALKLGDQLISENWLYRWTPA